MLRPTSGLNPISLRSTSSRSCSSVPGLADGQCGPESGFVHPRLIARITTEKPHASRRHPLIMRRGAGAQRAAAGHFGSPGPAGPSPHAAKPSSFSSCLELYVISDLHTDYPDNMQWVEQLAASRAAVGGAAAVEGEHEGADRAGAQGAKPALEVQSVLIVAGDISDCLHTIEKTLRLLKRCFWQVFFVPGNHELWVTGAAERHGGASDSCEKLQRVLELCQELGVLVTPQLLGPELLLVPLLSWHHKTFDCEPDIPGIPNAGSMTIADYMKCRWPEPVTGPEGHGGLQLAEWMDSLNHPVDNLLKSSGQGASELQVISFSHFVPDQRLAPEKRYLSYPNLVKAIGSDPLRTRLQALAPIAHVFGHTHFAWDAVLEDGVRYVQAPLCYPMERKRRHKSIVLSSAWQQGQDQEQLQRDQQEQRAVWERLAGTEQQGQEQGQRQEGQVQGRQQQAAGDDDQADEQQEQEYEGGEGSQADETDEQQQQSSLQHPHPPVWLPLLLYRAQYKVQIMQQQDQALAPPGAGRPEPEADRSHVSGGQGEGPGPVYAQPPTAAAAAGWVHPDMLTQFWHAKLVSGSSTDGVEVVIGDWEGRLCPNLGGAMWSQYYKMYSRTPENLELAPWVAQLYARRLNRHRTQPNA